MTDFDMEEFDKILNDIPKQIDGTPEAPEELKDKNYNKKLEKKLKAAWLDTKVKQLMGLKNLYDTTQKEIEKDFIYKSPFFEKIGEKILKRNYLRIMIVMPNGTIKEYNKPIKTGYVKVMKGRYTINLKSMVKYKGKNTLFYHYNNPFPIQFDSDKFPYVVDAQSLENMFTNNIVNQIFAGLSTGKAVLYGFGMFAGIAVIVFVVIAIAPAALKDASANMLIIIGANKWKRK